MALTINELSLALSFQGKVQNPDTKAILNVAESYLGSLKDASNVYFPEKVLVVSDYDISSGGNLNIDLYDLGSLDVGAGAGRDNLGFAHTNSAIHFLAIRCRSDSAGDLRLDFTQSGGWTSLFPSTATHDLNAGSFIAYYGGETGLAVADSTNHILRLTAQGGNVSFDLLMASS